MPELPDIEVYVGCLAPRIVGQRIERIRLLRPFVLRSVAPPLDAAGGRTVESVARLGKRVVIGLAGDLFLVLHLMIAGRLRWRERGAAIPRKLGLAALDFSSGTLLMTEAGSIKRAALHLAAGPADLQAHDRGGLEPLEADPAAFRDALTRENHTLKRSLTDPRLFSGIGNAYSDEILHAAGLSPLALTQRLTGSEITRLHEATRTTLRDWTARLRREAATSSRRRSPPSAPGWRCTAATASPARPAAVPSSTSSTPATSRTTAPPARPAASCSPTAPCRACSSATGRGRWMSGKC